MELERRVGRKESRIKKGIRSLAYSGVFGLMFVGGCIGVGSPPYPTGVTDYKSSSGVYSVRGMVYNCRTGHVDIAHAKKFTRETNKHAETTYHVIKKRGTNIKFPGKIAVRCEAEIIAYPSNWGNMDPAEKEKITREVSIKLGQYFAHCNSVSYEVSGWYGHVNQPFVSESESAFSWEDIYSDNFGIYLAGLTIKPEDGFNRPRFNERVSQILERKFDELGGIQPASVAKKAALNVAGDWCIPGFFGGKSIMRNLEFGNDNGKIKPCIPKLELCRDVEPFFIPIPNLDVLDKYGFKINIKLSGNCKGIHEMKEIVGKDFINPPADFPKIRRYLEEEAVRRWNRCCH